MKRVLLIDSNNLLHRVYWVSKNRATNTSVYYLFLNSVKKYCEMFDPTDIYCVWDKRLLNKPNFRNELSDGKYKETRDSERNNEVCSYAETTSLFVEQLGVRNIYPGCLEADDLIYWLSSSYYNDSKKMIVSVDKDLLQLVDNNTTVYSPIKDILITEGNFQAINGVERKDFVNMKALIGDKSDNINGIPRCGLKTVKKILKSGDIKSSLTDEHYKIFNHNIKLVDLSKGIQFHPEEEGIYYEQVKLLEKSVIVDFDKFKELCVEHDLQQIINNINIWKAVFNKNEFVNRLTKFFEKAK